MAGAYARGVTCVAWSSPQLLHRTAEVSAASLAMGLGGPRRPRLDPVPFRSSGMRPPVPEGAWATLDQLMLQTLQQFGAAVAARPRLQHVTPRA